MYSSEAPQRVLSGKHSDQSGTTEESATPKHGDCLAARSITSYRVIGDQTDKQNTRLSWKPGRRFGCPASLSGGASDVGSESEMMLMELSGSTWKMHQRISLSECISGFQSSALGRHKGDPVAGALHFTLVSQSSLKHYGRHDTAYEAIQICFRKCQRE